MPASTGSSGWLQRLGGGWYAAVAATVLLLTCWTRAFDVRVLGMATASVALAAAAGQRRAGSWFRLAATAAVATSVVVGWVAHRRVAGAVGVGPAHEAEVAAAAQAAYAQAVQRTVVLLSATSLRALEMGERGSAQFDRLTRLLQPLVGETGEVAAVVFEGDRAAAWAGTPRVEVPRGASQGVQTSEFYTVAYAASERGSRRVVVTHVLHARPPADRIAPSLAAAVAEAHGIDGFDVPGQPLVGDGPVTVRGDTVLWVRAVVPPGPAVVALAQEHARAWMAMALGLALVLTIGATWWGTAAPAPRLAVLALVLAVLALAPLRLLSNWSPLFDAGYFYSGKLGPFSASVAALALSSVAALIAVLSLLRARYRLPLWGAIAVTVAAIGFGPFLLRDLARGITLPVRGVSTTLWVAWQVALFVVATGILLLAVWASRSIWRGGWRVAPGVASAMGAAAALVAPAVWSVPGRFPWWYPIPWIGAMVALVLARRSRAYVLHAAFVAACGATVLVWGVVTRGRVELAQREVAALTSVDPETQEFLERLTRRARGTKSPSTREDLLRLYVGSALAFAGNPLELAVWPRGGGTRPTAELVISRLVRRPEGERGIVREADSIGTTVMRPYPSRQGVQLVLAAPLDSATVLTAVAAPRTQLTDDDPFAALFGLEVQSRVEQPFTLTLAPAPTGDPAATLTWVRQGYQLHGDRTLADLSPALRAHAVVDLRTPDALVPRGALLVLLDIAVLTLLWLLTAAPDSMMRRWLRARLRRWHGSYRARLTVAFFAAFVLPAVTFAVWGFARLRDEDALSRAVLVQETLRGVAADAPSLERAGEALGTPLLRYRMGALADESDPLLRSLAPLGLLLQADVAQRVLYDGEDVRTYETHVGAVPTLVGLRVLESGAVVAAPARRSEATVERQQRDLLVLLTMTLAFGGLAALWASGLAARAFARPIAALRRAAEEVAGGARTVPSLGSTPPSEFRPVYDAFRRMTVDLAESESALEAARRRTEAVLRDVASGVIALDADGRVVLTNPQAEHILGVALSVGAALPPVAGVAVAQRVIDYARGTLVDQDAFDLELRGRQLRARLTRIQRGGGGAVLTLDDVTDLARAQRVFAWGEMARQVAHEIKNPLTPIRLGVQHVRRAHADHRPDFDQILEHNAARILDEIDRLDEIARSFAKFGTSPGERREPDRVDVAHVVRDVIELERLGAGDAEWTHTTPPVLWAFAHEGELREVLLNVLENARLAGATTVHASVSIEGDHAVVRVADDGVGIDEALLERVFEPHFSTRTSGSGLGLAISRRLVESWGGSIRLQRRDPRGAIAEIALVPAPTA